MSALLQTREPSAQYLEAAPPSLVRQFELLAQAPGGVVRLRELILVLAVQGKLTRRDSLAEPAPVLLARILKLKASLIDAGNVKRDKPLPAIDETDPPFDIPQSWCWIRLGSVTNYGSPSKGESIGPETWVLDLEDIEKSTGRLLKRVRRSERPALSEKSSFQTGDVLYGKLRPYLNKVIVADEPGVCTTELVPFRCYGDWVPQYFRIALSSPAFLEYVNARSYGMKMPRLGTEDARMALLPLPPLEEQARIVARVDELMQLCDALEAKGRLEAQQHARLLETLLGTLTESTTPEELAANWQRVAEHFDLLMDRPEAVDALEQTILALAIRGRLGSIKQQEPHLGAEVNDGLFTLPTNWKWTTLADLQPEFQNGASSRGDQGGMPTTVIRLADIKDQRVSLSNTRQVPIREPDTVKYRLRDGDILITRVNGSADIVGQFNLIEGDPQAIYCDHFIRMRVRCDVLDPRYLTIFGASDVIRGRIRKLFISTAGQKTVNQGHIGSLPIAVPPLREQARIVARVTELRRLCADLRQRLASGQATQSRLAGALVDQVA